MAGRCNTSQDAQDAWDAGDASLASGRNADGSDAGSVFADVYIHQESTEMVQNINNVQYALMPAGGAQQPPPAGQTYHLPGHTLVGE